MAECHIGIVFDTRLAPSLCCLGNIRYLAREVNEVTCSNCTFLHESRGTQVSGGSVTHPKESRLC